MRVVLASLAVALALALAPGAAAATPAPTRMHPIVVGSTAISLGALETWTRRMQAVYFEREMSREAAAQHLVGEAELRNEARRRRIRLRGRKPNALEHAVARAIAGRTRSPRRFVQRFRAHEARWEAATRCTPYWSLVSACRPEARAEELPTVWAGATDISAVLDREPPRDPFWMVAVIPERFGVDSDRNGRLLHRVRSTIRRVPGLRRRLGEILNEGEITVFALDERAAERVALELFLLQRRMLRDRR